MALTKVQDGGFNLTDAGMPAGSVLQVVQQVFPTYVQFTSTSYADTGITKAITPSSTSSKILAMISVGSTGVSEANGIELSFQLVRASTVIETYERAMWFYDGGGVTAHIDQTISMQFLDSPSTASAVTYKVQARTASGTLRINDHQSSGNASSTLTLMEIAG